MSATKRKTRAKRPVVDDGADVPPGARRPGSPRVVAVTGAFGWFGRKIITALEARADIEKVVAVDVRSPLVLAEREGQSTDPAEYLARHRKLSAHQIDLTEAGADRELVDVFTREEVGVVLHLAFLNQPTHALEMAHELETIGTMYVLNAVAKSSVRHVVSLSSTMCYGAHADNPGWLTEDQPLRPPQSRFVRDKADADRQARTFAEQNPGVGVCVLRMCPIVGGSADHFWTRTLSRLLVPRAAGYDPLFQFLHADDAVRAILLALSTKVRGAYNVVGRGVLPLSHVVKRLDRTGLPFPAGIGRTLVGALWSAQLVDVPPGFVDYFRWPFVADGRRFEQAAGFRPMKDVDEALAALRTRRSAPGSSASDAPAAAPWEAR